MIRLTFGFSVESGIPDAVKVKAVSTLIYQQWNRVQQGRGKTQDESSTHFQQFSTRALDGIIGIQAARVRSGGSLMSIAEAAKQVYEEDLRFRLERDNRDEFVAIEPSSRSYFLGKTFLEVALAAKEAYPERKSFVIRIGHEAAFHIGGFSS